MKNPKYGGYQTGFFQWFAILIKILLLIQEQELVKMQLLTKTFKTNNYQKNDTHQLLEKLKSVNYNNPLRTKFGVMILQICN